MTRPETIAEMCDGNILKSMVGDLFENQINHIDPYYGWFKERVIIVMLTEVEVNDVTYELGSGGPLKHYQCSFFVDFGEKGIKVQKETFFSLKDFKLKYKKINTLDRAKF